jgi:hypothetical protein
MSMDGCLWMDIDYDIGRTLTTVAGNYNGW